ncbi:MAG: ATP-binding protein [Propionibacteriaceae bacterium]
MAPTPSRSSKDGVRTGLRLRIAATIATIVVVAVTGLGLAVHVLIIENRVHEARTAADERLHAAVEIYDSTGLLSFDAQVDDPDVPRELRDSLREDGARGTYITGGSTRELWAAGRTGDTILSTHLTFRPLDASVRDVDRALVAAGAVTVLVATSVGALSASRLSRRLRFAARTARAVAGEDRPHSLRSAVGPGRDEVGDLADAVDAMAARLADRLHSEQRFTTDVAHDLRTPVTGLVTAAALLDDSRPAELVRDRAATLTILVEELLEVARLDSGVETAELELVRIHEVVDRAVRRGVAKGEYPADDVVLHAEGEMITVLTDPRRLERVLSNLIRNALHHGRPPVEITTEGRRIRIVDHGAGFDPDLLAGGPQRFRSSRPRGQGHGLGLVIASGQAAVLGADLTFANAADGGAQVSVVLPAGVPRGEEIASA